MFVKDSINCKPAADPRDHHKNSLKLNKSDDWDDSVCEL